MLMKITILLRSTLIDSLGIKRRTAYAIVRRVEGRGEIVELSRGRRHMKVDDDMRRQL